MCCGRGKSSSSGGNEDDGIEFPPRPSPPSPPRSSEELGAPLRVGDQTDGILRTIHTPRGRPISTSIDPAELSSEFNPAQRDKNRGSVIYHREQSEEISPFQALLEYVSEADSEPAAQATLHSSGPVHTTESAAPAPNSGSRAPLYKDEPEAPIPIAAAAAKATLYSKHAVRGAESPVRAPNSAGPLERPLYIRRPIHATPGTTHNIGHLKEPPPVAPAARTPVHITTKPLRATETPAPAPKSTGPLERPLKPAAPRAAPLHKNESVQTTHSSAPGSIHIDLLEGHSNVGRPMVREGRSNLSEIVNLSRAVCANGHIRSPSGNVLSAEQFMKREDRPMLMEERQEAIRRKVAEANRKEHEKEAEEEVMEKVRPMDVKETKKGKTGCWSWGWGCFNKSDDEDEED
ncbi:hypothetical protein DOTSEDRAFT_51429 [Dothistroma septosporum NZE10]|uniref:Uncharacterized protein n=1 Tax=Dothistroma septosporum (strain NZE10 / CBS 128990) TaxID=675120 RepID=N1Q165_DOTSN|nr:hypothetical protein DOTSEDRAFT_51429 [Dothistroma septosporum NZE10]